MVSLFYKVEGVYMLMGCPKTPKRSELFEFVETFEQAVTRL
jgi:hypothetical protein